jgi:hypothetical protein
MPGLNGTGPEGKGPGTGRKLGKCSDASQEEKLKHLGKGMGRKRHAGGGKGKGKRLRSGLDK